MNKPHPIQDIDVARLNFFRSVERLLKNAEQAKRDRDQLLSLMDGQNGREAATCHP